MRSLVNVSDFIGIENFVDTGINLYICEFPDWQEFQLNSEKRWLRYESNQDRSLFKIPQNGDLHETIFRSYSWQNILQFKFLTDHISKGNSSNISLKTIDDNLMKVNIKGQTFFTLFKNTGVL